MCNKIKNKIYHAVGTFLKYNREMKQKNTTLSEIYVRAKGVIKNVTFQRNWKHRAQKTKKNKTKTHHNISTGCSI